MKTYTQKKKELEHSWYLVDAEGMVLGRLASKIAQLIRGKHKPTYTPHMDGGDYVVVVNAEKVLLTGRKMEQKCRSTPSESFKRQSSACFRNRRSESRRCARSSRSTPDLSTRTQGRALRQLK
jgi:ribosomal protein L13